MANQFRAIRSTSKLIENRRRHPRANPGSDLRRQFQCPPGIFELRFTPIIGVANIDSIWIQLDYVPDAQGKNP